LQLALQFRLMGFSDAYQISRARCLSGDRHKRRDFRHPSPNTRFDPTKPLTSRSSILKPGWSGVRESALKRNSKLNLVIGLATALAGLAGCAGKVRYPNFYVLNVPAPVSATAGRAATLGSIAVREFDAPAFLKNGPIVYRESPNRLGFYEYERWAVDPRRAVTGAVIREMQARGTFQSVDRFDGRATRDCVLTGAVEHLEEVDHGAEVSIEVSLSAQLTSERTGEVLWQGRASKRAKLDQRSISGVVAAMSREVGIAVQDLVSSMQDHVSAASLPPRHSIGGQ